MSRDRSFGRSAKAHKNDQKRRHCLGVPEGLERPPAPPQREAWDDDWDACDPDDDQLRRASCRNSRAEAEQDLFADDPFDDDEPTVDERDFQFEDEAD